MTEPTPTHPQPADSSTESATRWVTIATPPYMTTERMGKLHAATTPLLEALRDVARGQAARRSDRPVPAATLADARAVFTDVRRVLSRACGPQRMFVVEDGLDWAGLMAKLELALAAFALFRERYGVDDDPDFIAVWRTPEWLEFCYMRAELAKQGIGLPNSVENLSP